MVSPSSTLIVCGPCNNLVVFELATPFSMLRGLFIYGRHLITNLAPHFIDKPIFPLNHFLIGGAWGSAFQQTAHVDPDARAHSPPWMGRWINRRELKFSQDHRMVLRRREGLRRVLVREPLTQALSGWMAEMGSRSSSAFAQRVLEHTFFLLKY